jgi:uncharacterized protein (DUF736 family)
MPDYDDTNKGVLFPNRYKEDGDKRPNYTGTVNVNGEEFRLAAWDRTSKNNNAYLSVVVSEPREKEVAQTSSSEEVPF